jgi:hypothetical protein
MGKRRHFIQVMSLIFICFTLLACYHRLSLNKTEQTNAEVHKESKRSRQTTFFLLIGSIYTMFDDPTAANQSSTESSPWTHVQFDTSIVSRNMATAGSS